MSAIHSMATTTRRAMVLFLVISLFCGCTSSEDSSQSTVGVSNDRNQTSGELPQKRNPVTVEHVNAWIARLGKDEAKWHHGQRPDGEPVGKWLSQDGSNHPLVFEKDGRFKCGFPWSKGKGEYATGRYAISDEGLVVAIVTNEVAGVSQHFHLEEGRLIGARGPRPNVEWRRTTMVKD